MLCVGVKYPVDWGTTYKFRSLLLGVCQVLGGPGVGMNVGKDFNPESPYPSVWNPGWRRKSR